MLGLHICLLALALLQAKVTTTKWLVEDIINQLNYDLNLKLNIYLDCGRSDFPFDDVLQRTAAPSLLLSTRYNESQSQLLGRFTERTLTIAYLEAPATVIRTLDAVVQLLWRLHQLPVLYVLPTKFGHLDQLFQHSLAHGLLRVLALQGDELYTYLPYPRIKLLPLQNLSEFRQLTQLSNLQGQEVNITRDSATPRCFQYTNRQGRRVYAGYMYELIHQFINRYNGTEISIFDDVDPINNDFEVNKAVKERRLKLMSRPQHPANWFSDTTILYYLNVYIIAPYARPLPKACYFLQPFSALLWVGVLALMIYATALLGWLHRRSLPGYSVVDTYLEVLQLLSYLPLSFRQHHSQGWRHVIIILMLTSCGFILTNLYWAQLLSMLTAGLYERQLNSFDDLSHTQLQLLHVEADMVYLRNLTENTDLNPQVLAHAVEVPVAEVSQARLSLNTSYMHMAYEDRTHFVLYQQKFLRVPLFKIMDDTLYQTPFFVPACHGLPYLELFNSYQRRVWESGIFAKMNSEAFEKGIMSGIIKFRITTGLKIRTFDMESYYFAYSLLLFGWTISLLAFVGELSVRWWKRREAHAF